METMEMTTAKAGKPTVPQGWRWVRVNDVARMGSGHTPDKKKAHYYNGGIKWVSLQDSSQLDTSSLYETTIEISAEGLRNSSAVLHPANTVILLRDAGVGKSSIIREEMAVSQHFIAWQCGPDLLPEYLYYFLQYHKPHFEQQATGSTIKTLGLPFFQKLYLLLPPLPEQQHIVAVLEKLNETITGTQALFTAKRTYKSGLMQQLLTGQRRFPEFQEQPATVSKLAPYLREVSVRNRQLAVTRVLSVTNDRGFVNQSDQFEREVASADRSNYKIVRRGQFGYNPSRINVGSIALLDKFEEGALSPLYIIFETDASRLDTQYIKHFFKTDSFNQQLKQQLQGSVRDILSFSGMCQLQLFIPSLPEQQRIATVLTACDQEIELLQAQLWQWQQQKKGLMQQLLTGQLRVPTT